ncbi:hypothetical protein R3P38DRAFT_2828688 [Favolaschia claudopus]|uniref:Extracellular membrane protein CFEM domain-containing protein n=1 Tax=Favolaschia claudopus TaxID=2862362 RepID=A0AAW0EAI4_9AGAR
MFFALGTLLLLQTQTTQAAGIIPPLAREIPGVQRRDLTVIPAACQTGCAPFQPFLTGQNCSTASCCSPAFEQGYFDCFMCVGTNSNATDFSIAQEFVDVLITACRSVGSDLPVLTLPGQNPNRTLVSELPPGASTIPVFPNQPDAVRSSSTTTTEASTPTTTRSAPSATSPAPSPSGSAPPNAAVKIHATGMTVGLGISVLLGFLV